MSTVDSPVVTGLDFHYDPSPQHSPQWLAIKRGRIGSSNLYKWLATSKAKATLGQPLKARLDYEKELMFERQFNTNFEHYQNSAMQEGNEFEEWIAMQYELQTGQKLERVGCWYNEWFASSPDRHIIGKPRGVEIKLLKDNSFTDVLANGVIEKHRQQIQGQLWSTGWEGIDYVPVNFNSGKIAIIPVERDEEFIEYLKLSVQEKLVVEPFKTKPLDIIGDIPVGLIMPGSEESELTGGW